MYFRKAISAKWISFILHKKVESEIKFKQSINAAVDDDNDDNDERLNEWRK